MRSNLQLEVGRLFGHKLQNSHSLVDYFGPDAITWQRSNRECLRHRWLWMEAVGDLSVENE